MAVALVPTTKVKDLEYICRNLQFYFFPTLYLPPLWKGKHIQCLYYYEV